MNPKPFLTILAVTFGLVILGAIVGGILESRFKITTGQPVSIWIRAIKMFYLLLFVVAAVAVVPLVMRFFISVQIRIGNGNSVLIEWLAANEQPAVYTFWGLIVVGLGIALPAAIKGGFFK